MSDKQHDILTWIKSAAKAIDDDTVKDYANVDGDILKEAITFTERCIQKHTKRLEALRELLNNK